jgi:hypothetical protein
MANNLIQIKRTSVSGRAANTTTLPNPGELALNMTDGILYSGNGSVVFEIGANNTNVNVTGNLTVKGIVANGSIGSAGYVLSSNGSGSYWANVVGFTGSTGYVGSQGANSLYTVGNTTPISATPGDRWFHTDYGAELVYTYDGDSYQWVEISATGFLGATGYTGSAGYIGLDGYTGSTGYVGSAGIGYTGSIGFTGSVGTTLSLNYQTSSYVATTGDNGGLISITTGGVTINSGVFSAGQNFTVYNNSGSNQTITANGVTVYLAGTATTGNRTLAQRGLATLLCVNSNIFTISGPGVS